MHILGKVLLFLVVIGWGLAAYWSAQYLDMRNQWMARWQKLEKEYNENIVQVETRRKTLALRQKELARVMLPWDRYYNVAGSADPAKGQPAVDLGTNRGLQEKQVLFVFEVNADGTSTYDGAFRVTTAREDRSQMEPIWRMRAGDVPGKSNNWRVRWKIPAHYETRFNDAEVQFLVAEEDLKSQQRELARQKEAITVAEEHLQLRLGEINGVKELEGKPLPAEVTKGLLTVMVEEEEIRNAALAEVDRLLRSLKDANERFERVRRENSQLVGSLPQPEPAAEANVDVTNR